jgi:hypothetical protein
MRYRGRERLLVFPRPPSTFHLLPDMNQFRGDEGNLPLCGVHVFVLSFLCLRILLCEVIQTAHTAVIHSIRKGRWKSVPQIKTLTEYVGNTLNIGGLVGYARKLNHFRTSSYSSSPMLCVSHFMI